MVFDRLKPSIELEVCCKVEVIKGGFTGIFLFVFSLSVISISESCNSDASFSASLLEVISRLDFFVFNLKAISLSSCLKLTSISQYSFGEKAFISFSRSTTRRTATD